MAAATPQPGDRVRFTVAGLIVGDDHRIKVGDEGEYLALHPDADGWHLTRVEVDGHRLICPVHTTQFEVVR